MDYEFNIKEGDPATNSLMAEMVTRLTEAEEARWRELLADAWDQGHHMGTHFTDSVHWNPYRETKDCDMGDKCKHLWQVVPPDGMAEGYWRCRFCGATQDDPLELDSAPPRTDLPDAGDILHRINTQTSLGSVFGSQTDPETLYMPTSLICRLLDGEDA